MPDIDSAQLDLASVGDLVAHIQAAEATVPAAVAAAAPQITAAIEAILPRLASGGRLFYVGAGTPGRLAMLDAAECPPTFSTPPEMVQALMAGGTDAAGRANENAEDDEEAGAALVNAMTPLDVLMGIAASGTTPFTLAAVRAARAAGLMTVGFACRLGTPLAAAADFPIEVDTGPEVVDGSTRMKAGSAQKQVLNTISTAVMVKLGRTYGNLMVDVHASNAKLRTRAVEIVVRLTGVADGTARDALEATCWRVPAAVLVVTRGLAPDEAIARQADHPGPIRDLLGVLPAFTG